jgi:hypothetical protein
MDGYWLFFVRDLARTDGWTDSSDESALGVARSVDMLVLVSARNNTSGCRTVFCRKAAKAEYKV